MERENQKQWGNRNVRREMAGGRSGRESWKGEESVAWGGDRSGSGGVGKTGEEEGG